MRVPPNLSLLHTAFGDPLGISLLGGLSVAVYRLGIRVPQGVPANTAVAARSTLAEGRISREPDPRHTWEHTPHCGAQLVHPRTIHRRAKTFRQQNQKSNPK